MLGRFTVGNGLGLVWSALLVIGLMVALTPEAAGADEMATEQARQHYEKGKQEYDLGKWDGAIAEFEQAYRLRADPTFLFNMAQACRRKGDLQRALDLYKNYLIANPDSERRDDIEKRIRALEKEIKSPGRQQATASGPNPNEPLPPGPATVTSAPAPAPVPLPAVPAPPVAEPAPAAPMVEATRPIPASETKSPGRGLRVAGIAFGAAGLASIGTAIYFYTRAVSLSDKVSNSDAPDSDYRSGKDAETMQWVLYLAGGGALATGAILYWLGWPAPDANQEAASVVPVVGPGMAGLSAQGRF
jgi:tetratricopeptide (TPR) repeat protein